MVHRVLLGGVSNAPPNIRANDSGASTLRCTTGGVDRRTSAEQLGRLFSQGLVELERRWRLWGGKEESFWGSQERASATVGSERPWDGARPLAIAQATSRNVCLVARGIL